MNYELMRMRNAL